MEERVATLIIEPRSLVCEALGSMMAGHCYRVVGGVSSLADIDSALPVADVPKLVILGALPAEEVTAAASCIRKRWPGTKIIYLFEHAASADFRALLASEIDGCIPLSVSPDVLIGTLRQLLDGDLKILVHATRAGSVLAPPSAPLPIAPAATAEEARLGAFDGSLSIRVRHGLSEREELILRDLVKGHSNKIIARKCGIAEATIKVHMKSILRKIRVANRTQAAIWAVENGYGTDGLRLELPQLEAIRQPLEVPQYAP